MPRSAKPPDSQKSSVSSAHGDAREEQRRGARRAPRRHGDAEDRRRCGHRAQDGEQADLGEACRAERRDAQRHGEGRARVHAEKPGLGQRVARRALHEEPRETERRARHRPDQRPRNAKARDDERVRTGASPERREDRRRIVKAQSHMQARHHDAAENEEEERDKAHRAGFRFRA